MLETVKSHLKFCFSFSFSITFTAFFSSCHRCVFRIQFSFKNGNRAYPPNRLKILSGASYFHTVTQFWYIIFVQFSHRFPRTTSPTMCQNWECFSMSHWVAPQGTYTIAHWISLFLVFWRIHKLFYKPHLY